MAKKTINIEDHILRTDVSTRGGGVEISLNQFGFIDERMTAYQNYLGDGMLGRVANDCTINGWKDNPKLVEVAEELRKYFFCLTIPWLSAYNKYINTNKL